MNPFLFQRDVPENTVVPRVYARAEQFSETNGTREVLFDSVDADWFDSAEIGTQPPLEWFDGVPLRIVAVRDPKKHPHIYHALSCTCADDVCDHDVHWCELTLRRSEQDTGVTVAASLLADSVPADLIAARAVEPSTARRLSRTFSFAREDFPDAHEEELRTALAEVKGIDYVTVYDVGQGNCNALCDGYPRLYYDFGGGCGTNNRTFPGRLRRWCFTGHPPIVLSHWDWDHWSSAGRDVRAHSCTWIAPRQLVGASHMVFASSVKRRGALLFWPTMLADITVGDITIEKCTGSGRNDSGLALIVAHGSLDNRQRMLLTGDAHYEAIPSASHDSGGFVSIVVPHHGGAMRRKHVPPCPRGISYARLVYSYGKKNSYEHPLKLTRANHRAAGWIHGWSAFWPKLVRHTAARDRRTDDPAHISLHWNGPPPPPPLACGGSCDLMVRQT